MATGRERRRASVPRAPPPWSVDRDDICSSPPWETTGAHALLTLTALIKHVTSSFSSLLPARLRRDTRRLHRGVHPRVVSRRGVVSARGARELLEEIHGRWGWA